MADNEILDLLEAYDSEPVGSAKRVELGQKIEDVGKKMKDTHVLRHVRNYMERLKAKRKLQCTKG